MTKSNSLLRGRLLAAAAMIGAAACASSGGVDYQPADSKGYGYTDFRIESDRYRVTFAGDGGTPQDIVEAFALRRAAELALAGGYDWFRVVGGATERSDRGGVNVGAGFGGGSFGRRGGVNVGVGGDLGRVGARPFYTTRLEVLMGSGEKPADDATVYDARSILEAGELPPETTLDPV
ncbi:MAG: hypothetical protein AAFX08_03855 [Pseudomonadota bacterium]